MGYRFSQTDIQVHNPYPANQAFRLVYEVEIVDADEPDHGDYVQMWASDGTKWLDHTESAPATATGGQYGVFIDVPGLPAGYYDISITLADGTAAGSTVIVEDPASQGGSGSGSESGTGDEYYEGSGEGYYDSGSGYSESGYSDSGYYDSGSDSGSDASWTQ